jgi:hypothetical protein
MAVQHHLKNERVAARILTVDPAQRRCEAAIRDGAMIQIRVWEIPTVFRWPATGEVWLVQRNGLYWELVSRLENNEDNTGQIENVPEGATQIHGTAIKAGDGRDVLVTDESAASEGDVPVWNDTQKQWIPGAAGGGGGAFCIAGLQSTLSHKDLHTFGAAAYPALGGSFPAQYFLFPLDYIAAQSGGFSTSRVGLASIPAAFGNYSLSVPEAGWYMVTMQCAYYDIEFTEPVAYGSINHWMYGNVGGLPSGLTEGPFASGSWGNLVVAQRSFFNSTSDNEAVFDQTFPEQGVPWMNSFHVQMQGMLYLSPDIAYHTEVGFEGSTFTDGSIFLGAAPRIIPGSYIVTLRKFT